MSVQGDTPKIIFFTVSVIPAENIFEPNAQGKAPAQSCGAGQMGLKTRLGAHGAVVIKPHGKAEWEDFLITFVEKETALPPKTK
jgi:hypothetical protein